MLESLAEQVDRLGDLDPETSPDTTNGIQSEQKIATDAKDIDVWMPTSTT